MATPQNELVNLNVPQKLDPIKGVKKLPLEEYFTSGHRTCQGCESARRSDAARNQRRGCGEAIVPRRTIRPSKARRPCKY